MPIGTSLSGVFVAYGRQELQRPSIESQSGVTTSLIAMLKQVAEDLLACQPISFQDFKPSLSNQL